MTDAQAWTLILGSLTVSFGLVGVVTSTFTRVLRTEIGSVHREIGSVHREIDSLRTEMRSGFAHLDRDVEALMRHVFRQE